MSSSEPARPDNASELGDHLQFGDTDMLLAVDETVSPNMRAYVTKGWYEASEVVQVQKIFGDLEGPETIVELGAGLGLISTVAWKTGKVDSIHCYEADARLIQLIERTHRINGVTDAVIHNLAITSDEKYLDAGFIEFHLREDFWGNSLTSEIGRKVTRSVSIPTKSIQSIIDEIKPTMIICDIEGAEEGLFTNVDLGPVKVIALEVHQSVIGGSGMRALFNDLHNLGFHYDARYSEKAVPVFSRIAD